jgi:hypothetical protein
MKLRAVASVNTSDNVINRVQDNVLAGLKAVAQSPILGGALLKGVVLAVGDNTIRHGLGSALSGWTVVRQRAAATIYDKQDSNTIPASTLVLNSSAAVTVDLYVF